jgi:hypothetical protein
MKRHRCAATQHDQQTLLCRKLVVTDAEEALGILKSFLRQLVPREKERKTYARLQACAKGALINEDHREAQ